MEGWGGRTLTYDLNRVETQLFLASSVELLWCLHGALDLLSPLVGERAPLLAKLLCYNLPRPVAQSKR